MKETMRSGDRLKVVDVGCRVTIKNTETGEVSDFTLIPSGKDADPAAGRISVGSPLAIVKG